MGDLSDFSGILLIQNYKICNEAEREKIKEAVMNRLRFTKVKVICFQPGYKTAADDRYITDADGKS